MFSRTVAALLLFAVLPIGCGGSSGSPGGPSGVEPFVGVWVSEDAATRGITRVQIVRVGFNLVVRMWGACEPEDCDWGTVTATTSSASDGVLDLTWNQGFIVRTQRLTVSESGRLLVESVNRFVDNSGRADYNTVEYFSK